MTLVAQESMTVGRKLAQEHWDNYLGPMVLSLGKTKEYADALRFQYLSSWEHSWKHCLEYHGIK